MFRKLTKSLQKLTTTTKVCAFPYGGQNLRLMTYSESEAATWVEGAKKGHLQNIRPEEIQQCELCESIYHEVLEGRKLDELPPVCAVKHLWIKQWMMFHDSIQLYDPLSLDQSHDDDDEELLRHAEESLVVSDTPEEARKLKCGLYCCQENNIPM